MPRGNDAEAAQHELADRFGSGAGNAEDMIQLNAARHSRELRTLNMLPVDSEATSELDIDSLEGPNGEPVLDAAVRGSGRTRGTVLVYEGEDGRVYKSVTDYEDSSSSREKAKTQGTQTQKSNVRAKSSEGEAATQRSEKAAK